MICQGLFSTFCIFISKYDAIICFGVLRSCSLHPYYSKVCVQFSRIYLKEKQKFSEIFDVHRRILEPDRYSTALALAFLVAALGFLGEPWLYYGAAFPHSLQQIDTNSIVDDSDCKVEGSWWFRTTERDWSRLRKKKEDLRKPQILNVVLYCCLSRTAL